ncbi:calcium dependent mitochondrial carrier protein [Diaporthe eres]|nr:calcium dependent mitochondrial carrier protein [Diaporthe eres]
MGMEESQNQRDNRVEDLWRKLDPQGTGELDLKGLQKGLRRIDHPMKNADDLLGEIVNVVDTNRDGKIQYEEFRVFVEAAERQLLRLFKSIDRNHDGKLGQEELSLAFQKAGLSVPKRRLSGFFEEVDMNHDGYISFDEWRDFLLFMPTNPSGSPLEAALSYYSSIVTLNAEGDSMVTEETLEGIGTTGFLLHALFGSILRLAQPAPPDPSPKLDQTGPPTATSPATNPSSQPTLSSRKPPISSQLKPPLDGDGDASATANSSKMAAAYANPPQPAAASVQDTIQQATGSAVRGLQGMTAPGTSFGGESSSDYGDDFLDIHDHHPQLQLREIDDECEDELTKSRLTQYLPEPGYFLAGALAGGISRTATAPLDRLKVYLLVNTKTKAGVAADVVKQGQPLAAVRTAGKPIGDAIHALWKAGGFRTFFAGNGLNVIKIMPETAIKFGSYEAAKRTLATLEGHDDPTRINPYSKFAAGGVAGMTAQFCVYPLDTLKFRLQCETVEGGLTGNALLVQTAKKMVAEGAFRTAYRGITMGLVGMFPYSAIDMGTFEFLKKTFTRYKARYTGLHEEDAAPGNVVTGIIGATSGAFGATVVYPLNVLRTRLQTQGTVMHPPTYTGIWDVARKTYRNEGFRGMYKGLTPNLLKVAPALSITWIVYENSKAFLGLH